MLQGEQRANAGVYEGEQETNNFERVKAYLARHPEATDREVAEALTMSTSTANKWRKRVKETTVQSEHREQEIESRLSAERKDRQ